MLRGAGRRRRFSANERIRVAPAARSGQVPRQPQARGLALAMAERRGGLGARLARRLAGLGVRRESREKRTPKEARAPDR